jgi:acyl carrier protein
LCDHRRGLARANVERIEVLRRFLIEELSADPVDLERLDAELVEEEIIDSLGIFAMVEFLEDRFSIAIDPTDITIENFSTMGSIDALVGRKLGPA